MNYSVPNKNYYVVRNAGCTCSRYTLNYLLFFKSMNELINQQSISRTAHPPLKIRIPSVILQLSYPFQGDKFFLVSGLWQLAHLYLYSPRLKTLVLIPIQFRYLKVWALESYSNGYKDQLAILHQIYVHSIAANWKRQSSRCHSTPSSLV